MSAVAATQKSRLSVGLIALGAAAILLGSLGLTLGWGTTVGARSGAGTTSPTASAAERPAAFLAEFVQAVRNGNTTFLLDRVDPALISRYGEQPCRSAIPGLFDPTLSLRLRAVSGPGTYTYSRGGQSLTTHDVYTFTVDGVVGGHPATRHYHLALVGGRYRIFIACGSPATGS
jgi:hypothetical protein